MPDWPHTAGLRESMVEEGRMDALVANPLAPLPSTLGRYQILGALARGGMATVYIGRHSGEAGFRRLYAIK